MIFNLYNQKLSLHILKPNILFILVDSLRSDKCRSDQKTSITPNIDKLIKNGVYFEQTISSAAATAVAVSSIFTGLYPFRTGMGGKTYHKLNQNITNYVRILKENGYRAYSNAPSIATDFGLTFDFENKDTSYDNYYSLFAGLGDEILQKFDSDHLKSPWFFYIHLFDLHTPIVLPMEFEDSKFGNTSYEKMMSAIDDWIGKVLKKIDLTNTIVVLTADHGEYIPIVKDGNKIINLEPSSIETNLWKIGNKVPKNLYPMKKKFGTVLRQARSKLKSSKVSDDSLTVYQKRILFESRMGDGHRSYDDLIKVPLLFSGVTIPKEHLISKQVRHVDIFPTILDLIGIKSSVDVDGKSLIPIIKGIETEERLACIESPPSVHGESQKTIGLRTSKYKYIRDLENSGKIIELYDLENDPLEEINIADSKSDIVNFMENSLLKFRKNIVIEEQENMDDDEISRIEEKLKKLGYR